MESHDQGMLNAIAPLRGAGFALHWLHVKQKRPIGARWQEAAVASLDDLRRTYAAGNNLGVRLGEPSLTPAGFLHVIDLDIRIADLADEAWDALRALFPGIDFTQFPTVASGSGGASRHVYFLTDKPFHGKKLAVSEGKHRRHDAARGKDVWSYDFEIELFGTGKQVAMPPSIHPDTGKPYTWEREFDFDLLDLGIGPTIAASTVEALGAAETATYEFETREPLTFEPGQMERDLASLPVSRLDDYADWVTLGQALHHQFGGSDAGFEIWVEQSKRSEKFALNDSREMRKKWRGFGKNRRKPVTMASIRQWAQDARADAFRDEFDDVEDAAGDDFDDLLGGNTDETDSFDDILGSADDGYDPLNGDVRPGSKAAAADEADPSNWVRLLDLNEEGAIKPTLHNVELIIKNDVRLVGLPQINEFTAETVQRTPPGKKGNFRRNAAKQTRQLSGRVWDVQDTLNGEIWTSARDYAIRSILEAPKTQGGYGIKVSDRDLTAATVLAAWDNAFHPVREYLNGLKWDGKPRVERLFIDYLGAKDIPYNRDVARLMMVAGVTRIFEPGHKWDYAVILEGLQGRRKSTFIRTLGKHWFSELEGNFHDSKEMVEKMSGSWVMEIPELSGFNRQDVPAIKAFISRQVEKSRLAYERRAANFPRQCIFIGSTNDREYLKDASGGRRFFPMECQVASIDIDRLYSNVDQLWAEAHAIYRQMREAQPTRELPLYLTGESAAEEAARLQESRRMESADDALAGRVAAWLDRPLNDGGFDDDGVVGEGQRNHACLMQVWCEALGGDMRSYGQAQAQMLGRAMRLIPEWRTDGHFHNFPSPYGRQRVYERVSTTGRNRI